MTDAMFDEVSRCRQEITRLERERGALLEAIRHAAAWFDAADPVDTGACHVRALIKAVEEGK